jgi:hypothetical protein
MAKYTIEQIREWAERYKVLLSFSAVGREFGVSADTIRYSLTRLKEVLSIEFADERRGRERQEQSMSGVRRCFRESCGIKPLSEFYFDKSKNDYSSECKECVKARAKSNYEKNPGARNKTEKIWTAESKARSIASKAKWRTNNPGYKSPNAGSPSKKAYNKQWRIDHREHINTYLVNRRKNDINFRIRCSLRTRISSAVRNGCKAGSAVRDLGCSIDEFKIWIENQFYTQTKTGLEMSWANYGLWHLDHILPLVKFDLTDINQFKKVCHYTNYQPLWAEENVAKGGRIEEKQDVLP